MCMYQNHYEMAVSRAYRVTYAAHVLMPHVLQSVIALIALTNVPDPRRICPIREEFTTRNPH